MSSLFDRIKTTASVDALSRTEGKSSWDVPRAEIEIVIQNASIEDNPLMEGDFSRQFVGMVKSSSSVEETDRITVEAGDYAGVYDVKGLSVFNNIGLEPRKRLLLQKRKT